MADHLFGPSRLPQEPLKIEYNGPSYDGGPWHSYPCRQGWRPESPTTELKDLFIHPSQNLHLECWLYFGVLHAVFGQVRHEHFLHIENSRIYLTSAYLQQYVDEALAASGKSKDGNKIIFGRCSLPEFRAVEIGMASVLSSDAGRSAIRPEMLFAIRVLHASLTHAVDKRLGKESLKVLMPPAHVARDEWAEEQLRAKGWCPSELSCFTNFGSVLSQAYALQLRRPNKRPDTAERDRHVRCTAGECMENFIDETKPYETKHDPPHCRCEHVQVPIEKVRAILRNGGIPLVRVHGSGDAPANEEILEQRPGRNYVALSHVWSDGLGNKGANSLPSCQLHRLKEKAVELLWDGSYVPGAWDNPVSALHVSGRHVLHAAMSLTHSARDDALIWVDTLCVPLDDETRKLAIRGMKRVYEKGKRVIQPRS